MINKILNRVRNYFNIIYITQKIHPSGKRIYLRRNTTDKFVFDQIFKNKEYDFNAGFDPKVIVDCGANIGLASVFFSEKYNNAAIYAIEAEKNNFNMLLKNTISYEKIKCYNLAVYNNSGHFLNIVDNKMGDWGFVISEELSNNDTQVSSISLTDLMLENNLESIDILKIDIEGSELELFSSNYEYWLSRTKIIIIETHDWLRLNTASTFFKAILSKNVKIKILGENFLCYFLE